MTPTLNFSKHFLASRTFLLFFILFCLSGSCFAQNISLQELVSSSIQLNTKTIQASSLQDQLFPLFISNKINKIYPSSPSARNPVDLVWVFGIETEVDYSNHRLASPTRKINEIRTLLKNLLPLMTDQDRLAVVLFYNPSFADNLFEVIGTLPITKLPSLVNTSAQNRENIILSIGEKMVPEGLESKRALKAAMKILNQRNETNRTTGVFISTSKRDDDEWRYGMLEDGTMKEIRWLKDNLGLQERWIIQMLEGDAQEQSKAFVQSLAGLRAGVVETKFLLKPEDSDLLKGVEIQGTYSQFLPSGRWSFAEGDGTFTLKTPSLKPGLEEEFFFDLRIPKITQDLPISPLRVKIASYQAVFVLEDGSEVVKNADLTLKIVREGEEILQQEEEEEESKEAARKFYRKWGEDWLIRTAWSFVTRGSPDNGKAILKRYRKSLDDSIVKDDQTLQNLWREAERRINEDEERGAIYCW